MKDINEAAPGWPAARQLGAAMLSAFAVVALIVACPSSNLVVWTYIGPLVTLLLIGPVLWLAPSVSNGQNREVRVCGWLTFVCGVVATAWFVARAVGAQPIGGGVSGTNFGFFVVVASCWWPGAIVALLIWALEEWVLQPAGRARCWAQLQAGLVSGAWGLIMGLGWLIVFPPARV
jgi:hypothetical protein